jgi:hypothetical protein
MVSYVDRDISFHFSQFTQLQFDDNRVSGANAMEANITAILAFYTYIILGLDYDSFSPNGGNNYFKKAQNVVNNAPEQGKDIVGWKAVDGTHNRYWLADQLLSPRFQGFHTLWYTMHREALDYMYLKPVESRQKILNGVTALNQISRDNPGAFLLQFFFNAKSDELSRILNQAPKEERGKYITMLSQMDVANAGKYSTLK